MSRSDYDVAILGGGLAGLSLAVRLAEPRFRHLRILIVEPRTQYRRDKTWCYWRLGPHPFEAAVTQRWTRWLVTGPGGRIERSASGMPYECIPADEFYELALARIAGAPNIEMWQGIEAAPIEDCEGVCLGLPGGKRARLAFDSRRPPKLGQHGLAQRFVGREVEVSRPIFDPGCATLMDLEPAREGVHFTYVLPTSRTRALVEDTWFAPPDAMLPCHSDALAEWLHARRAGDCRVLFEEAGCLPMDPHFQPARGRRLVPLGAAAGAHRPATGYAFGTIQTQCDSIRDDVERALAEGRMPPASRRPAIVRGMDRALLTLLTHRPAMAPRLFPALFAHCPAHRLVRFLADRPNAGDLAAVIFATARGLCQATSEEPATSDVGNPSARLPALFHRLFSRRALLHGSVVEPETAVEQIQQGVHCVSEAQLMRARDNAEKSPYPE